MKKNRYTLTMLVENEPGVTARITGLFAGRGYNIETICGAPTANPKMSRITITTHTRPGILEQCMKQIKGLINVIKLRDMTGQKAVKREMALICVKALPENQDDIKALIQEFNGTMIDESYWKLSDAHRNLVPVLGLEGSQDPPDSRRGDGV